MQGITDNDITDTNRDTNSAGALDLRAADFHGVVVTNVFLDRSDKPRRHHVEIDRTGAEAPPERTKASGKYSHQDDDGDYEPPDPAFAGQPVFELPEPVTEPVESRIRPRQQPTHATACDLVVIFIPVGIFPRDLVAAARIRDWDRRFPYHCLSVPTWTGAAAVIGPRVVSRRTLL